MSVMGRVVPHIIAIVGGSCSGKTTLAGHLRARLGVKNCLIIRQDDYYVDIRDRVSDDSIPNFDIPEAIDFDTLYEDLHALKNGEPVALPNYDFATHRRTRASAPIRPRDFIIVEGLLLLTTEKIRGLIDHSYYIKCPENLRFARRLVRDVEERGRTEEFVKSQFYADVEPAHVQWVRPSAELADDVIAQEQYTANLDGLLDSMAARCNAFTLTGNPSLTE